MMSSSLRNLNVSCAPSARALRRTIIVRSQPASSQGLSDPLLAPFALMVNDGRTFKCTACGKCCTGSGEVWVTDEEVAMISAFIGKDVLEFSTDRTKTGAIHSGFRLLKDKPGSDACIFLQEDNKCSIHTVRPGQCSTYPWWPDLVDKKRWEWEKENTCEGFDHPEADALDLDSAARQLQEAWGQDIKKWIGKERL